MVDESIFAHQADPEASGLGQKVFRGAAVGGAESRCIQSGPACTAEGGGPTPATGTAHLAGWRTPGRTATWWQPSQARTQALWQPL